MNRDLLERMRAVESEYLSCHAALVFAVREWSLVAASPEWHGRRRAQAEEALRRLEDTYIIRLFSEFEAILREYWLATETRPVPPRVDTLMNRLGSKYRLAAVIRAQAGTVQRYRNSLVHRSAPTPPIVSFSGARRSLNFFIAGLPEL